MPRLITNTILEKLYLIRKMIPKMKKNLKIHLFVELVETNPLMYNTLHFDQYSLLAIRLNIFRINFLRKFFKKPCSLRMM